MHELAMHSSRIVRREHVGCVRTYVVSPNCINLLDLIRERHCLVSNELDEVVWCALSSEELELEVNRA